MEIREVQEAFLVHLDKIQIRARYRHNRRRSGLDREDYVGEVVALSWKSYLVTLAAGKEPDEFMTVLVDFSCRAVNSGRGVERQRSRRDYTHEAHDDSDRPRRVPFKTDVSTTYGSATVLDVVDPRGRCPAEAALAEIGFAEWRAGLSARQESVLRLCLEGYSTSEIAEALRVTAGAVSQHRRALHGSYAEYCTGE